MQRERGWELELGEQGQGIAKRLRTSARAGQRGADMGWMMEIRMMVGSRERQEEVKGS